MKVRRIKEEYAISGQDENGLFPKEANRVSVAYIDGQIYRVYFKGSVDSNEGESLENYKDYAERCRKFDEGLNLRELSQDQKEKIVGLLQKLSTN